MISVKDLKNFDPAEYLESDEDIAIFLDEAFKSGSAKHIVNALGIVAKAKGMTQVAQQCGIRREQLYRSLEESEGPTLQTLLPILQALRLQLDVSLKRT